MKRTSESDVITNSSSECFIIYDSLGRTSKEIEKLLQDIISNPENWPDRYRSNRMSGMGGELEVHNWEEEKCRVISDYLSLPDGLSEEETSKRVAEDMFEIPLKDLENKLFIDLDNGYEGVIRYIFDQFKVYDADCHWLIKDSDGYAIEVFLSNQKKQYLERLKEYEKEN